jgi:hypothetical protein
MPDITAPKPLDGKTTIDDKMFFEPERLGYESVVEVAKKIADQVHNKTSDRIIVIAGPSVLADFANLQAVHGILDSLLHDYNGLSELAAPKPRVHGEIYEETFTEEAEAATIPSAAALVGSVVASVISPATTLVGGTLGLVSLFRSDVEYHGEKTSIDTLAFEIALANQLRANCEIKVFIPDLTVLPLSGAIPNGLQDKLEKIQKAKANVWAAIRPMISQLVQLEGGLDDAVKNKNQDAVNSLSNKVSALRGELAPISDPLARLDQRLSELQAQWNQKDPATGMIQLARLLRAEALRTHKPLYLHASVVSSGGHYRISRNLFRMLFLGDGLSFAGGVAVRWALIGEDGSIDEGGIQVESRKARFGRRGRPEQF